MKQPDTSAVERDAKCKKVNLAHWRDGERVIDARKYGATGGACAMAIARAPAAGKTGNDNDPEVIGAWGLECRIEAEDFWRTRVETVCALGALAQRQPPKTFLKLATGPEEPRLVPIKNRNGD